MTKEEQEAIEKLKDNFILTKSEQNIISNYINKLQKENEHLKEQLLISNSLDNMYNLYISKDKIRDKIKELEEESNYAEGIDYECNLAMQDILNELLEEE